ncbi:mitochondrial import inner membrane translocase subunit Tim17/22 [Lactarius indigo]|nr:mitochondrial import inner membrane translocase subunit Tim17/22 [Lactarius indigo]
MAHADHTRDPCPWVILNDFGGAFAMGCRARNSPRGERLAGSISTIKSSCPCHWRQLGVWGGNVFYVDCAEDAWNAIISGVMTGGCLAHGSGPKAAFGSAVACGILLGVLKAWELLLGRVFSEGTRPQLPPLPLYSPESMSPQTPSSAAI